MPRKSSAPNALKRSPFNVREVVGSNIKRHRLALGWSWPTASEVSRAAVSQYEIATGKVNAGDLPRLADLLGIGLLDFYASPEAGLRPIDRQQNNHPAGSWAVESAAMILRPHESLVSPSSGRPRDTRHRRPASLAYVLDTVEEKLLGGVDIAEAVKLGSRDEAETEQEARTGEVQAGKVQAGAAD